MVVALVLLFGLIALSVAAVRGWTFDSRDPDFTLRDVFSPRRRETSPATAPSDQT